MLGLYVSDHPLLGLQHVLDDAGDISIGRLTADDGPREGVTTIAGMITAVSRKTTRRGDPWAQITVEDLEASVEVLIFPRTYDLVSDLLATDTVVSVRGKITTKDDAVELHADEINLPDLELPAPEPKPLMITLPGERCTPDVIDELRAVLASHHGPTEVRIMLRESASTAELRLAEDLYVTVTSELVTELKALLGPSAIAR
jgi:DNA polymerase-3 subunit alpha